jgi:protein O-GlcNAc transferase
MSAAAAEQGVACLATGRWADAAICLRAAAESGDESGPTLLNLALAEDRIGEDGRGRMRALAHRWPRWDEPSLRLAESFRRGQENASSIAAYEETLAINPHRREALLGLGAVLLGLGEAARARPLLLRCCAFWPEHAPAWDALGMALRALGDDAGAILAFAEASRLAPDDIGIALRRVEAARAAGEGEAELARLAAAPPNAARATARGALLVWLGRSEDALGPLRAAVAAAPEAVEAAAALADALIRTTRLREAVPALRHALALAPGDIALRNNLAAALTRTHAYAEARDLLRALIAEHGERPEFLCNLANALVLLGEQQEGVAVARRATEIAPEMHLAWRTLGASLVYAEDASADALRDIAERASAVLPRTRVASPRAEGPERRLRLGLLSAKLMTHPVAWLTLAAFETLDRDAFEIVCFGPPLVDDAMQRRFRAIATEWHVVVGRPTADIAALIRAREIDVLIDLGGWGDQGLLSACGERPAPVQVKWVGNQAYTTGMPEIDWMLTDRWETPAGFERFYRERLLRLPDGYACYAPPDDAPEVTPLPALARGHVSFGAFHNLAKVTPSVIAAWARVLHRVPDARLLFKSSPFADAPTAARVVAAFVAHGIAPERIEARGPTGHRTHLAQHADIDIMLDAFPYTGGLTTCESLWMGVPVVTLAGEAFAARHSSSHLSNVGLVDWIAERVDDYVELAVHRVTDLASLATLRAGLRERMRVSPLCDAPRFARHLGAALGEIWREACARA